MARLARLRHLRHGAFGRTERSKHLRAFLAERAASLAETGSSYTFTVAGAPEPEEPAEPATGLLAGTEITADDSVTIGSIVYTFVAELSDDPTVPYEVLVGESDADSIANLVDAVEGDEEALGIGYSEGTEAHPDVTAEVVEVDNMQVTAIVPGVEGNAIDTLSDLTEGGWGETTLEGGKDLVPALPATGVLEVVGNEFVIGEGPFLATSTDEIPDGMSETQFYWIMAVDGDDVILTTRRGCLFPSMQLSKGAGELTLVKAEADPAIFEYLRQNAPEVVRDADDVDDL